MRLDYAVHGMGAGFDEINGPLGLIRRQFLIGPALCVEAGGVACLLTSLDQLLTPCISNFCDTQCFGETPKIRICFLKSFFHKLPFMRMDWARAASIDEFPNRGSKEYESENL
jgi:hypothetical protein